MAAPYFTVNIATYNQLSNLKIILKALEAQSFKDFEVIITDDGSSDGTKEWAKELEKEGNLRYFWQEDEGFRLAKSKNMGIQAAKGKYFISLEADVVPNYRLLSSYKMFAEPDLILLGVRHDIELLPESLDFSVLDKKIISYDWRMGALRNIDRVTRPWRLCSGCNVLFPTDKLKGIGGWNEEFTHYGIDDYEVCLRLIMDGCKVKALPAAYGYHIRHDIRETIPDNVSILEKLEVQYESSTGVR